MKRKGIGWKEILAAAAVSCMVITSPAMTQDVFASGNLVTDGNKVTGINGGGNYDYLNIPDGIRTIGESAFYMKKITGVHLPDSVRVIEDFAFFYCDELEEINLPEGITSIGESAFEFCESLEQITLPSQLTVIKSGLFSNCVSLQEIVIPSKVTRIEATAFNNCRSLENVVIPPKVTSIGLLAFNNCINLETVEIPQSVTQIGEYAFDLCERLTIRGYRGSYAETYAYENNIDFEAIEGSGSQNQKSQTQWGWSKENGKWYWYNNSRTPVTNQWIYDNGSWYWLGYDGVMYAGQWLYTGGAWYYLSGSGAMATGWQNLNGSWYYLDTGSGAMYAKRYTPDGYYVNESGAWVQNAGQGGQSVAANLAYDKGYVSDLLEYSFATRPWLSVNRDSTFTFCENLDGGMMTNKGHFWIEGEWLVLKITDMDYGNEFDMGNPIVKMKIYSNGDLQVGYNETGITPIGTRFYVNTRE